jgi:hypothetical protein
VQVKRSTMPFGSRLRLLYERKRRQKPFLKQIFQALILLDSAGGSMTQGRGSVSGAAGHASRGARESRFVTHSILL